MKNYKYEQYDYSFLYSLLTDKQKEEIQSILDKYIGYPNTQTTRRAVECEIDMWFKMNNINIENLKLKYE